MQETWDEGSVPGSERCPGGGHGNPLQYSWLENPMEGGARQAIGHRVSKSQTLLNRLGTHNMLPNYLPLGLKNKFPWGVAESVEITIVLYTYLKWPKQETQTLFLQISLILHLHIIPCLHLLHQIFFSRMMQRNDESK